MDEKATQLSSQQLYWPLRNWCIGLVFTAGTVVASDLWLDQPIASFVHQNVTDKTIFVWLHRLPVAFLLLSLLVFVWCGFWALTNRPFSHLQSVGLACSISFVTTNFINNQLKYAFGRTWPETWIENNPSLVQNGVFGFNPFHGGPGFASFPSGHVAAVCAAITVLSWAYPNLRPISVACVAVVAIGLIGANYHFLSDIFAGIFVGVSVGYVTTRILGAKLISESRSQNIET
jgi:membrane-associated phospholipid phosphatase